MNAPDSVKHEEEWPFDGLRNGYLPRGDFVPPSCCPLHTQSTKPDAISFEVIRSNLWNINLEHGDTIKKASGSQTVIFANDFNTSLHLQNGESVVLGPSMLHFTGLADMAIRWTLEHRSVNPGIEDGDVFMHNDPWVGAAHQQDTSIYAPLFHEGRLFAWVLNACHARDIGGVEPGSFVPQAKDVFWESTPVPPIKLCKGGVMLQDVEEMFVRKSRLPHLCALELRSQVAGVMTARRRLQELIDRYGAAVVKGVMNKMIDDCAGAVEDRLSRLPDGTWRNVIYYTGAGPGDRVLRRQVLNMEKRGKRLRFDNAGTDAQALQTNLPPGTWRAHIVSVALGKLAYDQYLCAGGLIRVLDFAPIPGLRTSCSWPAAVTGSSNPGRSTAEQTNHLISKMLACDPDQSKYVWAAEGIHTMVSAAFHGRDLTGRNFAANAADMLAGATAALSFADGLPAAGRTVTPLSRTADVETWEREMAVLYLYRRRQRVSGHGKWVGGSALVSGFIGHGADYQFANNNTSASALPGGPGLFGGFPAPGGACFSGQASGLRQRLGDGFMPGNSRELREAVPHLRMVEVKEVRVPLGNDDVWETRFASGSGYGDPLLRDLDRIERDLRAGALDEDVATRLYGVVVSAGGVDRKASMGARQSMRAQRRAQGKSHSKVTEQTPYQGKAKDVLHALGEGLDLCRIGQGIHCVCRECGWVVAPATVNYKEHSLYVEQSLPEIDPLFVDPLSQSDETVICRSYLCPGCGTLFDSLLCRPQDGALWDVQLDLRSFEPGTSGDSGRPANP
jgi:N-methylhydantoinase B